MGLALCVLLAGCGGRGSTAATASPSPSVDEMRHIDRTAGFQIDRPASWQQYRPSDPKVQFLAGPNDHDFVQVRVVSPLPASFVPGDLQVMKKVSDALLSGQVIDIISENQTTAGGVPGYQYVYTFKDPATGLTGVHIHVFLFQGTRLITLVLQALPEADLKALAKTYDAALASFRVLPLAASTAGGTPAP